MRRYICAVSFLACSLLCSSAGAQSYTISTYVGPTLPASSMPAMTQTIGAPNSVISDRAGGFYFISVTLNMVYRVTVDGALTGIAGDGSLGFSGDGGPATAAQLWHPSGLALDGAGNLFIADFSNHRIRKVTSGGIISTVAGSGVLGFSGDDGPAVSARPNFPMAVALDESGSLFIADYLNQRIRKVSGGTISTVAGNGTAAFSGDGGPAISAGLNTPSGIAVDGSGNLFIADSTNNRIRKVTPAGVITTVAGSGLSGSTGDGGLAVSARFFLPSSVAVDGQGKLFITDGNNNRIRMVNAAGIISTVAGSTGGFGGDGGFASSARFARPLSAAVDASGNLFIADTNNHRIREVTPAGVITTVAGVDDDGGPASAAQLYRPWDVTLDTAGNMFIADTFNYRVRRVDANGVISTILGNGIIGSSGNGGPATLAQINFPTGIVSDGAGNLFIASEDSRISRLDPNGVINTLVGIGTSFVTRGIALDQTGNLFFADAANERVFKRSTAGALTIVAGNGIAGFSGDGGPATSAQLYFPWGLAVDRAGNLFIADFFNYRIRKVTPDGIITTVAGTGTSGFSGDGGPATAAQIGQPTGLALDALGNLFISLGTRIRRIDPAGIITTIAGNALYGSVGDGGPATSARLADSTGITVDSSGNVFIAEQSGNRIRKLTPIRQSSLIFTTAAGGGASQETSGLGSAVVSGFASIQPASGRSTPAGLAIFGFRQNNVLVTEAGVPASLPIRSGRIYAEVSGRVNTGLAIANPNGQPAILSFYFSDGNGDFGQGTTTIPPNGQIANFLTDAPFNGRPTLSGSFTFTSSVPVAVIALCGLTNERGEFLITTLPVDDLSASASPNSVVFPHFADGNGWTTQIVLVNPTDAAVTGTVQFFTPTGGSATLTVDGQSNNTFVYSISPRSSQKLETSGAAGSILSGSVRVIPAANSATPSGVAIFSFRNSSGVTVTEAGVPAVAAGNAFRLYAEASASNGAAGPIQTGLAVTSTSANPATVHVETQNLDGIFGLVGTIQLPANGQAAVFVNQIPGLASQPIPFQGTLRLTSSTPISVIGLRGRYNERGDFLITTTPPINENTPPTTSTLYFPHIVDAGGYTTQFILLTGGSTQSTSGALRFFAQTGDALNLVLK